MPEEKHWSVVYNVTEREKDNPDNTSMLIDTQKC